MPLAAENAPTRVNDLNWPEIIPELQAQGSALLPSLVSSAECRFIAGLYSQEPLFRSRIIMARHGFGRGEYKYFNYPLPDLVASLRAELYLRLAPVANEWQAALGLEDRFPSQHAEFIDRCHAAGQSKPTPLLLEYREGDFNCLHQDVYGDRVFPIQVAILLSEPGRDFEGGEFVLTEQRPRMQSKAEVVPLRQGDAVAFAVHHRPMKGARGNYRVNMRHGVSRIRAGPPPHAWHHFFTMQRSRRKTYPFR